MGKHHKKCQVGVYELLNDFYKNLFPLKDVLTNFLSGCGQMELKKQDLQPEKLRLTKRKFPQLWMSSLVSDTGDIESFYYYSP